METTNTNKGHAADNQDKVDAMVLVSRLMVYVDLFCLMVLALSIIFTRARLMVFFERTGSALSPFAYGVMSLSPSEWMFGALIAGVLLIIKERWASKKLTLLINLAAFLTILASQFAYVVAVSLSLQPR